MHAATQTDSYASVNNADRDCILLCLQATIQYSDTIKICGIAFLNKWID